MKCWLFPRNRKPTTRYWSNGPSKAKLFFPCSVDCSDARLFHFPVWIRITVSVSYGGPSIRGQWQPLLSPRVHEYDCNSRPLEPKVTGGLGLQISDLRWWGDRKRGDCKSTSLLTHRGALRAPQTRPQSRHHLAYSLPVGLWDVNADRKDLLDPNCQISPFFRYGDPERAINLPQSYRICRWLFWQTTDNWNISTSPH